MHVVNFDLQLEEISKVEGSAGLDIRVKNSQVEYVKFKSQDYKRFYTQAIEGRPVTGIPQLLSRICGTCSNAHLLAAIEAVEKTLNYQPTEQTKLLRRLTYHGLIIRDHALHLYLFVLPDLFNHDSLLEFDERDPLQHQLLHDAFAVKGIGNQIAKVIAGRSVHAPLPIPGGFMKIPDETQFPQIINQIKQNRDAVLRLIETYRQCDFNLERVTNYLALKTEKFGYLEGKIYDSNGLVAEEKDFRNHLEHVVLPYSQASAYTFTGQPYRVGALARININQDALQPATKKDAHAALKLFPSHNIYHNNLAQAIEILHSFDETVEILENNKFKEEKPDKLEMRRAIGVGVVEAPRGTLYHKVEVDEHGIVKKGEVIVPTGQNQLAIELDIAAYIQNNLQQDKEQLKYECEKIIRAYDPCISCSSHFLKVNWIED